MSGMLPSQHALASARPLVSTHQATPPLQPPSSRAALPSPNLTSSHSVSLLQRCVPKFSGSEAGAASVSGSVADATAFLHKLEDDFHADRNAVHAAAPAAPLKPPGASGAGSGSVISLGIGGGRSDDLVRSRHALVVGAVIVALYAASLRSTVQSISAATIAATCAAIDLGLGG
jgi:hypothetical protein